MIKLIMRWKDGGVGGEEVEGAACDGGASSPLWEKAYLMTQQ